jgi:hypothetical protein
MGADQGVLLFFKDKQGFYVVLTRNAQVLRIRGCALGLLLRRKIIKNPYVNVIAS